jgi:DNA (cytosine-5)-methyltransferase 1
MEFDGGQPEAGGGDVGGRALPGQMHADSRAEADLGLSPPRNLLSLFSGAGGLDVGFAQAGFRTLLAMDNMSAAVETFNHNHGRGVAVAADIAALGAAGIVEAVEKRNFLPLGVIGGPPCQGFSRANVGLDEDANEFRNRLLLGYADIVAALASRYDVQFFLFENVPGLLRERHEQRLAAMRDILAPMFSITELEVDAFNFGVPQHRKRLMWVGLRRPATTPLVMPTSTDTGPRTVREAIEGLPEPAYWSRGATTSAATHPNHWTMRPRSKRFSTGECNKWRSFRRLEWDQPSPTVAYGNREIHVHPDGRRRLSVFEAMRLQSFPDHYVLKGNFSEQVTQVSNAVPPRLAAAFARQIASSLEFAGVDHG